uniref:Uncharacterized protein n=1 Tax=Candidatus Kentrum sp. DK TaxID=2126562 RepID=A0A450SZC7_9GAMM|nr:MAG: hypothetical protein BECKDK2373B_GA0170837_108415 [Candidatus Kentron sp. DK]
MNEKESNTGVCERFKKAKAKAKAKAKKKPGSLAE